MDSHTHGPNCGCADFMFNENADDLLSSIEIESLECLNEAQVNSCRKIFRIEDQKLDKTDFVESDIDGEIFLIIPFKETVRVRSINIIAHDENTAAHQMKVYINNPNVNFDTILLPSVQDFIINANLTGEQACAVKISAFENVNQLALHLSSKVNDPIRISYVGIKGVKTEMKRQHVNIVYEVNPMAKETDPFKNTSQQNVY